MKKLDKLNTSISSFIRQDGTNGNCLSLEKKIESGRVAQKINLQCLSKAQQQQQQRKKQVQTNMEWKLVASFRGKYGKNRVIFSFTYEKCFAKCTTFFLRVYLGCTVSLGPIQNGHFIVRNEIDRKGTNKHAKRTALK